MPWTMRQVRYLLSSGSPLSEAEKDKMKRELHANPKLIRKKLPKKSKTKTASLSSLAGG